MKSACGRINPSKMDEIAARRNPHCADWQILFHLRLVLGFHLGEAKISSKLCLDFITVDDFIFTCHPYNQMK